MANRKAAIMNAFAINLITNDRRKRSILIKANQEAKYNFWIKSLKNEHVTHFWRKRQTKWI